MTTDTVVAPWRPFIAELRRRQQLSPTFLRVTLAGADLDEFADNGFDQRFKLVLPVPGHGLAEMPTGPDWYQRWRALPDERRHPIRTYTVRGVRPADREVDVDIVCHHGTGPAARWAATARPGDEVGLIGPDAGYPGEHGGVEFRPPDRRGPVLLAGDETAVPALCAILERLPGDARGEALLEVPAPADGLPVAAPAGLRVSWLPRNGRPYGSELVPAVAAAAGRLLATPAAPATLAATSGPLDDVDTDTDTNVDEQILWEVPSVVASTGLYAWLAGEAGVIRTLRRQLVTDRGLDRRCVAFMGYWRLGRAEAG